MRRLISVAIALAFGVPAIAAPATDPKAVEARGRLTAHLVGEGGSIAAAAAAFDRVCRAHPGDPPAQRAAAAREKPPFKAEGAASGSESFTAWPLQLTLLDTPDGPVCAVMTILLDRPEPRAALAEVRARLKLPQPAFDGESYSWSLGRGGARQQIGFSVPTRVDALGNPRPTPTFTLTATRAR